MVETVSASRIVFFFRQDFDRTPCRERGGAQSCQSVTVSMLPCDSVILAEKRTQR
jgi:hypothetical protein